MGALEILHKNSATLSDLKDGLLALGIPIGMDSKQIYVDFMEMMDPPPIRRC